MKWLARFKVLPLLVVVAALSFGVRFSEFVVGVSEVPGSANAQEQMVDKMDAVGEAPAKPIVAGEDASHVEETSPTSLPDLSAGEKIDWRDSGEADLEYSAVKMELFEDLKARRKELDGRRRELSVREALLKTAEQELDQKYKELLSLKSEIESLLVQQSDEEQKRIVSLVKIYEGMKPKDAARIFNTLDLDVLLSVVSRMSERKSAPVMASMSPERARTLTIMLMEQKSLSGIPTN